MKWSLLFNRFDDLHRFRGRMKRFEHQRRDVDRVGGGIFPDIAGDDRADIGFGSDLSERVGHRRENIFDRSITERLPLRQFLRFPALFFDGRHSLAISRGVGLGVFRLTFEQFSAPLFGMVISDGDRVGIVNPHAHRGEVGSGATGGVRRRRRPIQPGDHSQGDETESEYGWFHKVSART